MNNTVSMLSMKMHVTSHYGYKSKLFTLVMKSMDTSQMKQSKKMRPEFVLLNVIAVRESSI